MGSRDKLKRAFRKTVKWGGVAVTPALLVLWILSGWWAAEWRFPNYDRISVGCGTAQVNLEKPKEQYTILSGLMWYDIRRYRLDWWFHWHRDTVLIELGVPLWLPALLSLLATAAAWRADAKYLRRVREGACPACGYDRAGLAAGSVCPECGKQPEA